MYQWPRLDGGAQLLASAGATVPSPKCGGFKTLQILMFHA